MGLAISLDIFQSSMGSLFQDMPQIYVYVGDIIVLGSGSLEEHLEDVGKALDRLIEMGMQVNPMKTAWAVEEIDYLGFQITCKGIRPQKDKSKALLRIKSPESQYEVRHFVGFIFFYKKLYKEAL